ncbi:septation regulator SpoVG [Salinicoccus halitifaciens]|uniref:Putative septation protein SpoVG n=1 Tax=Salinicoccus halitifaciens TaxID=1073415 RepID=A0ABV2E9U5_9STAP|nr:septation regulator SpoVG [Salinicoccus halitifaciens]MCD2138326.1 septation regulator SpoVG [Salinicoccus halitifaciens]
MQITDVRLRKVNNQDTRMKALVSITFDDAFVIHDLRVIEGNNGLFVAMPSKRTPDGEFRDIAHPIHSDMRQHVQEEIMRVYDETEDVPETPKTDEDGSTGEEAAEEMEEESTVMEDEDDEEKNV